MKKLFILMVGGLCASSVFASGGGTQGNIDLTHRMMVLAVQVGIIIFAARIGNILFTKLRLPSVLGELCAGVLIGPFALGKLCPGWIFQTFAGSSVGVSPELYGLCTIASIVLLFLVGTETDLKMFMRHSAAGSLVGIGGVVASYVTGAAVSVYLLGCDWMSPTTILMGVMSTATSVSITARILSERRKLDSQEGVTILAGAVIDDVLGIIMLAIGMGIIASQAGGGFSWASILGIAGRSLGVWLGATVVGVLVSRQVAKALRPCGSTGEVAILTLGVALIVGGLFEKAHLAMIIGAYVTGLSFSRTDMRIMIQEKLHALYQFLVPIFFVVMGMMVDVTQFADKQMLIAGLIYTAVAVLAKVVGSGLPTLLFGFTPTGALRVGVGMVPRGEVALIIAGIAAAEGYGDILGIAVMMTLITTLVAPPLLIQSFNIKRRGHTVEEEHDSEPLAVYDLPTRPTAKTILAMILQSLKRDGFFVHLIDQAEDLYQARRGDDIITISGAGKQITFIAAKSNLPFIEVVMADALVEFETTLTALRKPSTQTVKIDLHTSQEEETAKRNAAKRNAAIAKSVLENNIILRLNATDRDGVVKELLFRLKEGGYLSDIQAAEEEVLRREEVMPTGVGYGVACPHARTPTVKSLVCAIGITKVGVDFSADEEGRGCRIIVLTLTPDEENSPYMTFITAMLTALRSPARREALLNAEDAPGIRKALLAP